MTKEFFLLLSNFFFLAERKGHIKEEGGGGLGSVCNIETMGGSEKFWFYWKTKKISSRDPGATQALVGSSHSFLQLFFFSSASISPALVDSLSWRNSRFQSLELLKERENF